MIVWVRIPLSEVGAPRTALMYARNMCALTHVGKAYQDSEHTP
jgi:hypothetical protein